jgi:hypothetical protein
MLQIKFQSNYLKVFWENLKLNGQKFEMMQHNPMLWSNSMSLKVENDLCDKNHNNSCGRPSLDFASCSNRTKQKRSSALCSEEGLEAVEHAFIQGLRSSRRKPVADIVSTVSAASPTRVKRISENLVETGEVPLTAKEALVQILDMD